MKSLFLCVLAFFQAGVIVSFAKSSSSNIKLKETGYKPEKNGDIINKKNKQERFYKFSGVELPPPDNQRLDLYFRVDRVKTGGRMRDTQQEEMLQHQNEDKERLILKDLESRRATIQQ
jgi:hypothetical protein